MPNFVNCTRAALSRNMSTWASDLSEKGSAGRNLERESRYAVAELIQKWNFYQNEEKQHKNIILISLLICIFQTHERDRGQRVCDPRVRH